MTSLCVSPDGKLLLSAGQIIKMWDLDTKEVYRVSLYVFIFNGCDTSRLLKSRCCLPVQAFEYLVECVHIETMKVHQPVKRCSDFGSELTQYHLLLQKFTGHSTAVTTLRFATTRPPDSNSLYFLSGAAHDRLLSVWCV